MRRKPERGPEKGFPNLEEYKQFTEIVINRDGQWKKFTIVNDPQEIDGKLHARVREVAPAGQRIQPDLDLVFEPETPPEIVHSDKFGPTRSPIEDKKLGGDFRTGNAEITKDGHVEYSVTAPDGKVYDSVPQEFLLLWKKTLELEEKVEEDLRDELDDVIPEKRDKLQQIRATIEKAIINIYSQLPDVEDMQDADRESIESIKEEMEELHKKTEKAIEAFEKAVAQVERSEGIESGLDNLSYFEKSAKADKEYEARDAEFFAKEIEAAIKQVEKENEEEKKKVLEQIIEQGVQRKKQNYKDAETDFNDKMNDYQKDFQAWQNRPKGKKGNKPRKPTKPKILEKAFDEDAVRQELSDKTKLSLVEKRRLAKEKEKKQAEVYKDVFEKMSQATGYHGELWNELNDRRREIAGRSVVGVVDVAGGPVLGAHRDFEGADDDIDSVRFEKNVEILNSILQERQAGKEAKIPDVVREAEIFDFDKERDALYARLDALQNKLSSKGKKPGKELEPIYNNLKKLRKEMDEAYGKKIKNLKTAQDTIDPSIDTITKLNEQHRLPRLQRDNTMLASLEGSYNQVMMERSDEKAEKELEEERKKLAGAEKREFGKEAIDIPDHVLRDILEQSIGNLEQAAEIVLQGGVVRDQSGNLQVSAIALEAFKKMLPDTQPANITKAQLREYGIKNWNKFKDLWNKGLAAEAVKAMDAMMQQTLERKIAENTSAWEKFKALKTQIIGRTVTNAALIGGGALAAHELVDFISEAENWSESATKAAQAGAVIGAGAAGGAIKQKTFGWFFGRKKSREKVGKKLEELKERKKQEIVKELTAEMFRPTQMTAKQRKEHAKTKRGDLLNGAGALARILSQKIRDFTTGSKEISFAGKPTITLSGNELLQYQDYLATATPETKDEETRYKLAYALSKMKGRGKSIAADLEPTVAGRAGIIDKALANISGKESMGGAVVANAAWSTALFALSGTARSLFGAAIGARLAAGWGETLYYGMERKEAVRKINEQLNKTMVETEEYRVTGMRDAQGNVDRAKVEAFRENIVSLKRMLHGNGSAEEMSAFVYRVKGKGKNVEDEIRIDGVLLGQLEPIVYEAERTGVMLEQEKDKANLGKVADKMMKNSDKILEEKAEELTKRMGKKAKKLVMKYGLGVVGAVTGAVGYRVLGPFIKATREVFSGAGDAFSWTGEQAVAAGKWVGEEVFDIDFEGKAEAQGLIPVAEELKAGTKIPSTAEIKAEGVAGVSVAEKATTTGAAEAAPAKAEAGVAEQAAPAKAAPEAEAPAAAVEFRQGLLGKGEISADEGIYNGMNKAMANAGGHEKFGMSDYQFKMFKVHELQAMEGKGKTIFTGDELELYRGSDGQPHFRLLREGEVKLDSGPGFERGAEPTAKPAMEIEEKKLEIETPAKPAELPEAEEIKPLEMEEGEIVFEKGSADEFAFQLEDSIESGQGMAAGMWYDDDLEAELGGDVAMKPAAVETTADGKAVKIEFVDGREIIAYPVLSEIIDTDGKIEYEWKLHSTLESAQESLNAPPVEEVTTAAEQPEAAAEAVDRQAYIENVGKAIDTMHERLEKRLGTIRYSGAGDQVRNELLNSIEGLKDNLADNTDFVPLFKELNGDPNALADRLYDNLNPNNQGLSKEVRLLLTELGADSSGYMQVAKDGSSAIGMVYEGKPIFHADTGKEFSADSAGNLIVKEGDRSFVANPVIEEKPDGGLDIKFVPVEGEKMAKAA